MSSSDPCGHGDTARAAAQHRAHHAHEVRRVFVVTLLLNLIVAGSKAGYGYVSGSIALGADSLHSILDASSNILALLGLHWAAAPADARHPYGRAKVEILAALGIGVLIVISLFEFLTTAISALRGGRAAPEIGWGGFAVVLGTMVVNAFVTRYEHRKGHELHSHLLCADAKHTESDLYASAAVILSFIAVKNGWIWADAVCALILVALVGRVAWLVFRDNVPILLDAAMLDPSGVADAARSVAGVANVHKIRSRGVRSAVELDLHMEVAAAMTVDQAHRLAVQIEEAVKVKFPEVSDVVIHVEPSPPQTTDDDAQIELQNRPEDRPDDSKPTTSK